VPLAAHMDLDALAWSAKEALQGAAAERKLAGAAKNSDVKKCMNEAVGSW